VWVVRYKDEDIAFTFAAKLPDANRVWEEDGTEISTTLKLDQGIHPYRLYYKTSSNKPSLGLQWEGPSVAKGSIPANALLVQGEQKR
jgi:hypothetical protein